MAFKYEDLFTGLGVGSGEIKDYGRNLFKDKFSMDEYGMYLPEFNEPLFKEAFQAVGDEKNASLGMSLGGLQQGLIGQDYGTGGGFGGSNRVDMLKEYASSAGAESYGAELGKAQATEQASYGAMQGQLSNFMSGTRQAGLNVLQMDPTGSGGELATEGDKQKILGAINSLTNPSIANMFQKRYNDLNQFSTMKDIDDIMEQLNYFLGEQV